MLAACTVMRLIRTVLTAKSLDGCFGTGFLHDCFSSVHWIKMKALLARAL